MQHRQLNRMFIYAVSVATMAIAAALIALGPPAASAAPRVINVNGIITAFTPKVINVTAGEQVSICLVSPDTDHDLTIPTVNNFQVVAPTGPPVCKTLTVPATPGTHKFICSISGHVQAGMVGSFVIKPAGEALPTDPPTSGAGPSTGGAPAGAAQAEGGPNAGVTNLSPLMLGGGLLIVALLSVLLGLWVARRD